MSVTQVPLRPIKRGSLVKFWLALAVLLVAAFVLARFGTAPFQPRVTSTGLTFRTVQPGTGDRIKAIDGVYLEYDGRLPDGKIFDSTQGRPVPMIPSQVIPGFSEALQMMQKGGRYTVRIPGSLGYGASPPPGSPIPPNSDLIFDVHVVEVVPNAALMTQQGAGQGEGGPPPTP